MAGSHAVDLNYLLHRHQISLMRADETDACEVRNVHLRFAAAYARRIDEIGTAAGATAAALVQF